MSLTEKRHCVFCGERANDKTREHVVPYWLLELTGDPHRVVTLGQNYQKDREPIRFAWSSFVAPACERCNGSYSEFEGRANGIFNKLQGRQALPVADYVHLLDWLDKVRVGVWLLRHLIERHPIAISPNFYINSRVQKKDRMVAIYAFDGNSKGINLFGTESQIFAGTPSCFGLRANNLLFLNISSDFFCSQGCGLPYPQSMKMIVGGKDAGKLELTRPKYELTVSHPVTGLELFKPVVWIYQPVKLPFAKPLFAGGYYGHSNAFDSRLFERSMQDNERLGAIFRQFTDRVVIHRLLDDVIEFDSVDGAECALLKDIAATVYDAQALLFQGLRYKWVHPSRSTTIAKEFRKLMLSDVKFWAEMYRTLDQQSAPLQ